MNKRTVALTSEQYKEIISTMKKGFTGCQPNNRAATALMLEANLGLRISDIVKLRLADVVRDGERYRLSITEQKTGKARTFTVPLALYQFIRCYCLDNGIATDELMFPITTRAIQKQLKLVCDYLDIKGIGLTVFVSSMLQRFTGTATTISLLSNSSYSIAAQQLPSDILASRLRK